MIVLAGGIGSGKSVVARWLRLRGFGVYDCDLRARMLMQKDDLLKKRIKEIAGEDIYDSEGILRRRALAEILFENPEIRCMVNKEVHEAVKNDISQWLSDNPNNIFVETAIPAESGLADRAEEIWMVEASLDTRLKRVRERDSRSENEIKKIIEAQENEEKRLQSKGKKIERIFNDLDDLVSPQIIRKLIKYA